MCRNIKNLRTLEQPANIQDFNNAALQFVRKVSGYRQPSQANQAAFDKAVAEISTIVEGLLVAVAPTD